MFGSPSLVSKLLTISYFFSLFPCPGVLHTLPGSWLFAWHMHDWVSWCDTHCSHTVLVWSFFLCVCALLTASSTLNTLSLCLYIFFIVVCLSVCLLCYRLSYFVFTSSGLPDLLSLPPLPFPVSTLWLRHFRWHPQTYSGFLTQSGHDPKWPTAQ